MKKALIIGGANGIGLAVALKLSATVGHVTIVDRQKPDCELPENVSSLQVNLVSTDFAWLREHIDTDVLFYSAGFGRIAPFETIHTKEIDNSFEVNAKAPIKILTFFADRLKSDKAFYCGVMVSIAGRIVSPLFSIYSATKAALFRYIENVNIELECSGSENRILEVSPGSIKGTRFDGGKNDLSALEVLADSIVETMLERKTVFIPDYEPVYKGVLARYADNPRNFGLDSYKYKLAGGRINMNPQVRIGYLSGSFDLFHVGHLNLLRRAKDYCDYLVVGVHKDGSHKGKDLYIPLEERMDIVRNIKYVDEVIISEKEDSDVYSKGIVRYDRLFVGSDYKGTERFNRYEEYFADKGVEIIYFPYTEGTSSTQLRDALSH